MTVVTLPPAGKIYHAYYFAGAQRVAMRQGGTVHYLLSDHLGSTSVVYNASTGTVVTQLYKPWGEVRYSSGALPTKYTYTGQYSNTADFGLMYYRARWYDPSLGRFSQADTIVPGAENTNAATSQEVANQSYTALSTGYYELASITKLNADNAFIQAHAGSLWGISDKELVQAGIVDVPLVVGVFDRYAYCLNNPVRYNDPTGHIKKGDKNFGYETDLDNNTVTLWLDGEKMVFDYDENNLLLREFMNAYDRYESNMVARNMAIITFGIGVAAMVGEMAATGIVSIVFPPKAAAEFVILVALTDTIASGVCTGYFDAGAYAEKKYATEIWHNLANRKLYLPLIQR